MKFVLSTLFLIAAGTAAAETVVLTGYVNENRRGDLYFVAVDRQTWELSATLPLRFFNERQVRVMGKCMEKKETHAIQVDQVPDTQHDVPTDIPGRTTTTHFPRYENLRCVRAPGFLDQWREAVRRSRFG
jgi:hypothetical protein